MRETPTGVPGSPPGTPSEALRTVLAEFVNTPDADIAFDDLVKEAAAGAGAAQPRGHRLRIYGVLFVVIALVCYGWFFVAVLSRGHGSSPTPGTLEDLANPSSADAGGGRSLGTGRGIDSAGGGASVGQDEGIVGGADAHASANPGVELSELSDRAWVHEVAQRTGIPERALAAYTGAALVMEQESPECGLGWNTLAGIGEVESHHGSIGGTSINANGYPSRRIVGVSLDGGQNVAQIPDTDNGRLDGDPQWDRALGPMQFIPSTWVRWAADGNTDGIKDPQNIDDAVLAAARYLCSAGGDMSVPDNWVTAVTSYNHSIDYNNRVAEQAQYYKELAEAGAETGAESETGAETGREG